MKKVINPTENIITLQAVLNKEYPIIGFKLGDDKVTLIPSKYCSTKYFARCLDSWEKGNGFDPQSEHTHTIEQWHSFFSINYIKSEMFVFDSTKELFLWLAE